MKNKILLTALILLSITISCDSINENTNDFKEDLIKLSNTKIELFDKTKSGEAEIINEDELFRIFEIATHLGEKYDIAEAISESSYYNDANESLMDMDFYESMNFLENNATDHYYQYVYDMILNDTYIDNSTIVSSDSLLPNEQIALILVNNAFSELLCTSTKATKGECYASYDSMMKKCRNNLLWKTAVVIGFTVWNPVVGAVAAGALGLDHDKCTTTASTDLRKCLETAS